MYLKCEDNTKLLAFYKKCNFKVFGRRMLDRDETDINGNYLVQLFGNSSDRSLNCYLDAHKMS